MTSRPPPHYSVSKMVFIGGIEHDLKDSQFKDEVNRWPGIVRCRYKGEGYGFGQAEFRTTECRDKFLKDKTKHKLGNKIVDIKPFKWDERPEPGTAPAPAPKPVPVPAPAPPFNPQWKTGPMEQALQNCQTGSILRYVETRYGMIKTSNGTGMFSADVVYLCTEHKLYCKTPNCPDYVRFTEVSRDTLFKALPAGTQVNFIGRAIPAASVAGAQGAKFQATLVWPQLSKKPSKPDIPNESQLDQQLKNYIRASNGIVPPDSSSGAPLNGSAVSVARNSASASAAATAPKMAPKPPTSMVVGAGRPQPAGLAAMPAPFTSIKRDYSLDDDLVAVDSVLDGMSLIDSFLKTFLASFPDQRLALTNRLFNLMLAKVDDQTAINEIFVTTDQCKLPVDSSKRANIIANFKTVSHTFRGRRTVATTASPTPSTPSPVGASGDRDPFGKDGKIYYDEAEMNKKFEDFVYNAVGQTQFRELKNDSTVRKQCEMISVMLRNMHYPVYILAAEYESCVAMLNTEARPNLNRIIKKAFEKEGMNDRILLGEDKVLELIWRFFSEEKFYECSVKADPKKAYDEQVNMETFIKMTSDNDAASDQAERKQHLPPFGYINHALKSMGSKVFMIHIKFTLLMNSVKQAGSGSDKKNKGAVLKAWRKEAKDMSGQLGLPEFSDRACDYIFAYLIYDSWVDQNKEVLRTKKGTIQDFEDTLAVMEGSSAGSNNSETDSDESGSDETSESDTDTEEDRSRGALGGVTPKEIMSLRHSRTDPSLMKKLLESEVPLATGASGSPSSSTSSSNEISVSTNTSELTRESKKNMATGKIVNVKLKQIGVSFRSNPPKEESGSDVDKFINSRPAYEHYKHLINWLKDNHKSVQRDYNLAEGLLTYVKFVVNVLVSAGSSGKPILELKEEFRKGFTTPSTLFAKWAKIVESGSKVLDVQISVDAVIKTIFQYCWETLSLPKLNRETNATEFLRLFKDVAYHTNEGFYNVRGLVVHTFGDGDFGLVQTRFGRVLFERNICHDLNKPGGSDWQRCKTAGMALKAGAMVKLHARVGKFKVKKSRHQYLYATKIWTCHPDRASEPASGVCVQGRQSYWSDAHAEFEKIIKANFGLRFMLEQAHFDQAAKDYRQAFAKVLKERHNKSLLSIRATGDLTETQPSTQMEKTYEGFVNFVRACDPGECEEAVETVRQMASRGINFSDLRKSCLLYTLTSTDLGRVDGFEEYMESTLLGMYDSSHQQSSNYVSACVTDIVPLLDAYFKDHDEVFNGQLCESLLMFRKEKEGSLSHLENAFTTINAVLLKLPSSSVDNSAAIVEQLITSSAAAQPEQLTAGQQLIRSVQEHEQEAASQQLAAVEAAAVQAMPSLESLTGAKPKPPVAPPGFATSTSPPFSMEAEVKYQLVAKEVEALRAKVLSLEDQLRKSNAVQETNNKTIQAIWSKLEQMQTERVNGHEQEGSDGSSRAATGAAASAVEFVKVVTADGSDLVEFPADAEGGNLSLKSVEIVYPGVNALKYKTPNSTRLVLLSADDVFVAPEDGWGGRLYYANIRHQPQQPLVQQQPAQMASLGAISSVPALAANGGLPSTIPPATATAPGMLPGYRGQPPFAAFPGVQAQASQAQAVYAANVASVQAQQAILKQLFQNGSV